MNISLIYYIASKKVNWVQIFLYPILHIVIVLIINDQKTNKQTLISLFS